MLEELERVVAKIKEKKTITSKEAEALRRLFGRRFDKALKLAKSRGVKKYVNAVTGRTLCAVVGREGEYEVVPLAPFCECQDFLKWALTGERHVCYHILAQRLAEALGIEDVFIIGAS